MPPHARLRSLGSVGPRSPLLLYPPGSFLTTMARQPGRCPCFIGMPVPASVRVSNARVFGNHSGGRFCSSVAASDARVTLQEQKSRTLKFDLSCSVLPFLSFRNFRLSGFRFCHWV